MNQRIIFSDCPITARAEFGSALTVLFDMGFTNLVPSLTSKFFSKFSKFPFYSFFDNICRVQSVFKPIDALPHAGPILIPFDTLKDRQNKQDPPEFSIPIVISI
jgi:hypothetical protein